VVVLLLMSPVAMLLLVVALERLERHLVAKPTSIVSARLPTPRG